MAKSRGRKFAEITTPTNGVFDIASVPTITNAKLQNSAMTLAGSSVSLGGTGVADTDALSEGSSNLYFTNARVQSFLGGGTLAGNIVVPDNRSIYLGSNSDFRLVHNTTNTQLINATGALQVTSNGGFDVTGAATFSSTVAVTGNITGTLATAAQTNITSVGTLTGLTVSATNILFDSNTYNILEVRTDANNDGSSDDGIIKITNSSSSTTKAELRWDESEDTVQLAYGDHGRSIVINSSGNVGIGTGSSTIAFGSGSGLEVSRSGTATVRVERTGSTASIGEFFAGNGKVVLSSISNNHLEFRTNNTAVVTIDTSGRTLIGQDSGDSFNADSMLRLQRAGDRVFMQFKTDANQNSGILFGDVDDDVECAIEYEPANKALTFSSGNNAEAIRIDTNGNIGIGEISPSAKFHLKKTAASTQHYDQYATAIVEDTEARLQIVASEGGSNAAGLLLTNEAKHWGIVHHGTGNSNIFSIGYHATSSNNTDISDNLSDILNITTGGSVGIGETNPGFKLHVGTSANIPAVLGSSATETYVYIRNSNAATGRKTYLAFAPANNIHGAAIYAEAMEDFSTNANRTADLVFETRNNGTIAQHMWIKANGDVGVGTSSPFGATLNRRAFSINGTSSTTLNIGVGGAQKGYLYSDGTMTQLGSMGAIPLKFAPNDSERARIDSNGNFGIGATSVNARLEVRNNSSNNYSTSIRLSQGYNSVYSQLSSNFGGDLTIKAGVGAGSPAKINFEVDSTVRAILKNDGDLTVGPYAYNSTSGIRNIGSQGRIFTDFSANSAGFEVLLFNNRTVAGLCSIIQYRINGSSEGDLRGNSSGLSIVNNSDYRKKKNIRDLTGSLNIIKQLQPRLYEYREEFGKPKGDYVGFIAHEIQEHIPSMVDIEKDAVYTQEDIDAGATGRSVGDPKYQAVAYSNNEMITRLVHSIQEQQAMIETLQAEVKALKGE